MAAPALLCFFALALLGLAAAVTASSAFAAGPLAVPTPAPSALPRSSKVALAFLDDREAGAARRGGRTHEALLSAARKTRLGARHLRRGRGRHLQRGPIDAAWFGNFFEGESTYTEGGIAPFLKANPEKLLQNGMNPSYSSPYIDDQVLPHTWFHESASSGANGMEIWQTHYPAVDGSIAGNRDVRNGRWRLTPEGWVQDYNPSTMTHLTDLGPKQAEWFDSSVINIDGFGRARLPYTDSDFHLLDPNHGWQEISVNTTIGCATPLCKASSSLLAYDATKMEARNCRLSIYLRATDYDNDWSKENVISWEVNGHSFTQSCDPRAQGCNATAQRPLYSCVVAYPVDTIISSMGNLVVTGQITNMVDECPYEGNLLSGILTVTCMLRPRGWQIVPTPPPRLPPLSIYGVLRCVHPGCNASTKTNFDPYWAVTGGTCLLSVNVSQTDFDDATGNVETIEWLSINGQNVSSATGSQPGKNRCTLAAQGTPVVGGEGNYSLLSAYDITDIFKGGFLNIAAKISPQVDECASKGYLLDGYWSIDCTPAA